MGSWLCLWRTLYPLGPFGFSREFSCLWSGVGGEGWEFGEILPVVITKAQLGKEGEDLAVQDAEFNLNFLFFFLSEVFVHFFMAFTNNEFFLV